VPIEDDNFEFDNPFMFHLSEVNQLFNVVLLGCEQGTKLLDVCLVKMKKCHLEELLCARTCRLAQRHFFANQAALMECLDWLEVLQLWSFMLFVFELRKRVVVGLAFFAVRAVVQILVLVRH
jgi:hypothetical protein